PCQSLGSAKLHKSMFWLAKMPDAVATRKAVVRGALARRFMGQTLGPEPFNRPLLQCDRIGQGGHGKVRDEFGAGLSRPFVAVEVRKIATEGQMTPRIVI